jgi:dTDP-4-amino-4,6-dideoxygalactose transaminase
MRPDVLQRMYTVAQAGAFIDGAEVATFESMWADYVGARYCVGVGNGTDALELAVRATWGAQEIGGLYVPAMTFVATAEAIVRAGENVALVDVEPDTLLAREVDVAVGLYGQAVLSSEAGVVDAAQMHGWKIEGTAAWSFYPTKNLGAWQDAGAVTTDDEGLAEGIREWARHGGRGRVGPGCNSRLDTLAACVLVEKLLYLDQWVEERRQAAESYQRRLRGLGLDIIGDRATSVFHQVVVRVPNRDQVRGLMQVRHVQCGVHYGQALSEMEWLDQYRVDGQRVTSAMFGIEAQIPAQCPEAEQAAREVLSLPLWPGMPISVIDRVVNELGECLAQAKREAE